MNNISGSIAIPVILGIVFLGLCALFVYVKKINKHLADKFRLEEKLIKRGYWILFACFVIIIVDGIILHFLNISDQYINPFANSFSFNTLTLLGMLLAGISLYLAYRQFKMQEDRIEDYEDFYAIAIEIFKSEKCESMQFSGSTTIPGHIAYGNPKHVLEKGDYCQGFKKCVEELYKKANSDDKKANSRLIIPKDFTSTYEKFRKKEYPYNFKGTEDEIKTKVNEIKHFTNEVLSGYCQFREDDNNSPFIKGFYLSNGKTMVYAMNVHYEQTDIIQDTSMKPILVGFKTQNKTIVKAFEERFNQQWNSLNDAKVILKHMYSKHIVNVEYIERNLKQKGLDLKKCKADKLYELDQDHFFGLETTKQCVEKLAINSNDNVLDIGSGFGGVSRYIAEKTKAKVLGIEIQKDRFDFAVNITKNLGLGDKVSFICDDFISYKEKDLEKNTYTKAIAILSILHFDNKKQAIQKVSNILKKDGMIYFEDYYRTKKTFTEQENNKLLKTISCPNLLSKEEYLYELKNNGISITYEDDLTKIWKEYAKLRYENIINDFISYRMKHGEVKALNALEFATGVFELFNNELIHGFRIIGKKL